MNLRNIRNLKNLNAYKVHPPICAHILLLNSCSVFHFALQLLVTCQNLHGSEM